MIWGVRSFMPFRFSRDRIPEEHFPIKGFKYSFRVSTTKTLNEKPHVRVIYLNALKLSLALVQIIRICCYSCMCNRGLASLRVKQRFLVSAVMSCSRGVLKPFVGKMSRSCPKEREKSRKLSGSVITLDWSQFQCRKSLTILPPSHVCI